MGQPSSQASNAIIYLTYGAFLVLGTALAWRLRRQSKDDFLASNRTQSAIPLALNFIASGVRLSARQDQPGATDYSMSPRDGIHTRNRRLTETMERKSYHRFVYTETNDHTVTCHCTSVGAGVVCGFTTGAESRSVEDPTRPCAREISVRACLGSGILFSYPQLATIAGVQGVVVYALSSSLPLFVFAWLGPIIRKKCPEGFVLTEWARQRYGLVTALFLSFLTLATMFLYMVAELSALQQTMTALTGLDGLPMVIVECVVTTIYTSLGGFKISFYTDNIQGTMVVGLIVLATIAIGVEAKIDPSLIDSSGLTKSTLLGWQLLYILPVAVLTNDFFLSNFWIRAFASKTDKDLWIGITLASIVVTCILTLVGCTGLIAAWTGAWPGDPPQDGSVSFFLLLEQLPSWVVGITLVMVVSLSTAAFDSLQSAMVSSGSNDLFRNHINIWWIRLAVVLLIIPVIILALRAPSILDIYLIADLFSASTIPVLILGLSDKFWFWRGFEVVVGGCGGILSVFIFGAIYFGNAQDGANLILLENGLYGDDWSAFGAFVAAPVGGLLWGFGAMLFRLGYRFVEAKVKGTRFDALDRPIVPGDDTASLSEPVDGEDVVHTSYEHPKNGKFF